MQNVKQSASKGMRYMLIAYAIISVLYTGKYFYQQMHTRSADHLNVRSDDMVLQDDVHQDTFDTPVHADVNVEISSSHHKTDDVALNGLSSNSNSNDHSERGSTLIEWHDSHTTMKEAFVMSKIFADAMQPSDLTPYFYKASASPRQSDITMATLVTKDRFPVLSRLASNYQGPISVAIHVNDDEEKDATLQELARTYESNPDMQQFVDVHLIVDTFDRQFNLWRNVAKLFARTDYVMMLDVDFHLCTNLRHLRDNPEYLENLINGDGKRMRALVVPAFEYVVQADGVDYRTFPSSKEQLLEQVDENKIDMFHKSWLKGHGATNYAQWYASNDTYLVTDYDFSYEPYIIYKKEGTPWCDERFIGYGANKAACLFEIYLSGIDYMVLPNDFLIHQTHKYPENTRRKERQYNRKLYSNFREEVCLRYARMFIASNDWDSGLADNLRKECDKHRGYRSAMKSIL
ncbi:glycosyl-transferase for dystroglycan-domain-containing protein [Gongronella butleri]|nr:glycosyl-transferase for dystroglycan-domain-containing protein [Gongronella butleri]